MSQSATIRSLPRAFRMMKAMQVQGIEWGEDYRRAGALALKEVLEGHMARRKERGWPLFQSRQMPRERRNWKAGPAH